MKTHVNSGMIIVLVLVLTISLTGTAKAANYLEITPADDFEPSGEPGGPFTPSSKDYELRNKGQNSLYWGADKTVDWLDLDQTWGQLEPHESTIVTVNLTSEANSLGNGIYTDTLTFTDITNGEEETRGVVLTINPTEGVLEITPIEDFEPSGEIGGPFTPLSKDYQLTNSGGTLLYWGAAKTTNWLNLDPDWGSLDPCESTIVTVTLTSEANSLGAGIYTDTLTFTDLTSNVEQTRGVTLTITVPPIWISPGSFDVNIIEGLTLTEMLTIGNNTLEDLNFLIRTRQVGGSGDSGDRIDSQTTAGKGRIFSIPKGHDFTAVGEVPYKPGELIVRFASKADGKLRSLTEKNQILSSLGGGNIKCDFTIVPGLSVIELPADMTVEEALLTFNEANGILYAQPNYELNALSTFPDDPRFDELWGMHNMGQTGGMVDADIDAPEAWDIATGSSEIVVAVIDTGVDYTHPDLAANMWVNEAEFNGIPGQDDDENGYVDDIYGYDFRNNDADPMDDHYHGTHCAGTIGAVGNNSEGVAGVCWNVRIMALKFLSSGGSGWTSDAILCVEYSVLMGANLSSNSWGGGGYNQGLKDAIDAAGADGMLFVAAAGNDGANNDVYPHYPSSYDCESLIAVLATDSDDERSVHPGWWASNYGLQTVDIGAPGSSILSCEPGGQYGHHSGTSMATPHVAGACALVWSMNPAMSNGEIKDILLRTVDPTLPELCVSEGRLNLYSAILETKVPWLRIEPEAGTVAPGDSNDISITFDAIEMAAGTYRAEIIVISSDPCHPTKVVPVTMTVNPDDLAVTPAEGFESSGTKGGPFTPECTTYTLTNNGTEPVNWTILQTEDWLEAIPYEGMLEPNEIIDVNVCISPEANLLDPNIYTEILIFQNLDSGSIKPRSITLTVKPPDCFTESFDVGENDLDFLSLTFSPDGSVAYYEACRNRIYEFPTDPNGGTYVPLWDDDFVEVVLSDGAEVLFYGQNYDRFYIGSNGYITFGDGDNEFSASLQNHFNKPRISALFTDLTPPDNQCISYKQLDDRVVVTYEEVPLFGDKTATNSFQIEVFFVDGTVCISCLKLAATASVAGLSEGKGLPPVFFVESNLTNYPPCWPWGDFNRDYSVNMNDLAVFVLHWLDADCNIPYWCEKIDLDFSTEVEMVDFAIFANNWMVTEDWWLHPISHWKFDEGQGDIAYDSAGTNHGTIYGEALWTTGQIDGALEFDGVDDYVDVGDKTSLDFGADDSFSISSWFKTNKDSPIVDKRRCGGPGGVFYEGYNLWVSQHKLYYGIEDTSSGYAQMFGNTIVTDNQWHHVVAVRDTATDKLYIYLNGSSDATPVTDATTTTLATNKSFHIGYRDSTASPGYVYCEGTIDDVRVYDRALSAEEIWQLYWAGIGNKAFHPKPANGAGDVDPNGLLSWSPGKHALSHDVYLGTDYNDVNDATPDSNEYMGNQDANSYDPNGLDLLTTYYWRIDEVGASETYKGYVWSFTTWQSEPEPDLVSWWRFDEGQGSIAYDSVGYNDGTIYGATWTTGQIDGALEFDGVDDYVDVGDPVDGSLDFEAADSFSISAWIKTNTDSPVVEKRRCGGIGGVFYEGYVLLLLNQKQVFAIEDTSGANAQILGNAVVADNQWHHVVAVRDTVEDKLYLYADGSSDATPVTDATTGTLDTSRSFRIGYRDSTASPGYVYFEGKMDDVRIYKSALSAEEIQ
jgi:subtilisin family serine protease